MLQHAVKGMLPKGPLGYAMLRKLKVYAGDKHPHSAQQPKAAGDLDKWSATTTTARDGARARWRGCSSSPARASIVVNGKPMDEFFGRETGRMVVRQPLELTKNPASFDIMVNVYGGGESGQAGAVRHGITRALIEYDAALKPTLERGRPRDARCARSGAKEGRSAQGAAAQAVLETLKTKAAFRDTKAASGRLFVFLGPET